MWSYLTLLLIAGAAVAVGNRDHAWEANSEYQYLVRARTLTTMNRLNDQFTGILMKGLLTIQVKSPHSLQASLSKTQFARLHSVLPRGKDTEFPDHQLEYQELPLSGKPFEIHVKHGVIRNLLVEQGVPIWEVNILKSIVSQLQVDTQGENAKLRSSYQIPSDEEPFGMYRVMEDSVGGKCEVLYDIMPLLSSNINSGLIPLPYLDEQTQYLEIIKTKNYSRCTQESDFHFGVDAKVNSKVGSNGVVAKLSTSRIAISGNLKQFTIQSSVTMNDVLVSPRMDDTYIGMVYSKMNLTLSSKGDISSRLPSLHNPVPTGNLVYTYGNPFSGVSNELFGSLRSSVSRNSMGEESFETTDSSSAEKHRSLMSLLSNDRLGTETANSHPNAYQNEQGSYVQYKRALDEAPESPLTPFFIDFNKVDLVGEAARLRDDIASELLVPEAISSKDTLEKFTLLIRLIRLMNLKQIEELQRYERNSSSKVTAKDDQNSFEVLRSAVAQAGTGPALLIIKKWIKEGRLQGLMAAQTVSIIPKAARFPTSEYVEEFFNMIKDPMVQKQTFLNSTAPYAFAELLYNAQISKSVDSRYPTNIYGPLVPKNDESLKTTYIPYLGRQLRKALEHKDSPRAQTYIMALSRLGHPEIFSIYEPYLEGEIPISTYERMLMVSTLIYVAENSPGFSRPILYKIYANAQESHEVRCAAIFPLMKTNPPLAVLLRMAQYTNYDKDVNVNSVVKSVIESISELDVPQFEELISKARIARRLLNPKEYNPKYSHNYIMKMNYVLNTLSDFHTVTLNTISSIDSMWPKAAYFLNPTEEILGHPKTEILYALSNLKQFFGDKREPQKDQERSRTEQIMHMLKMQPEPQEQGEGMLFLNNKYMSQVYPFDSDGLEMLLKLLKQANVQLHRNFVYNYDATISFPTETGMPFTYVLEMPLLFQVHLKRNQINSLYPVTRSNGVLELTLARKTLSRFGFMTLFDQELYLAGVDTNLQLVAPITYEYEKDTTEGNIRFRFRPNFKETTPESNSQFKLAHYSVIPYSTRQNILDLQPVSLNKNTHVMRLRNDQKELTFNSRLFRMTIQGDNKQLKYSNTLSRQLMTLPKESDGRFKMIDLYMNRNVGKDYVTVSFLHGKREGDVDTKEQQPTGMSDLPNAFEGNLNARERRDRMLNEVAKGVRSPTARALDVSVDIPYTNNQYIVTLGLASSNVDEDARYRTIVYFQSFNDQRRRYEICGAAHLHSLLRIPLDFEKAMERSMEDHLHLEMLFGTTCADGFGFKFNGTQRRTDDMKEAIMNSDLAKDCMKEMQEGNKGMRACQQANALAEMKNHFLMSTEMSKGSINEFVNFMSQQLAIKHPWENTRMPETDKSNLNMELRMSPDYKNAELSMSNSQMEINFPPFDVSRVYMLDKVAEKMWKEERDVSCTIDKTHAITFDNKMYPLKLGKCQHVMVMPSIWQNSKDFSGNVNAEMLDLAILISEQDDKNKKVLLLMDGTEISLRKVDNDLQVAINKERVVLPEGGSYEYQEDNMVIAEISKQNGMIMLISEMYELKVVYDGERIQLQLSSKYRNNIRGLCGNYDMRPDNDFISPKNCIMEKPEEFSAMYALTEHNCEGPAMKNRRRAEQATCVQQSYRQSNVISDKEAGRPWTENKQWGYHHKEDDQTMCVQYRTKIVENNENICFSTRPLPECVAHCVPQETKAKLVPLHCLPRNNVSEEMKRRIEQGANPDLSLRSVSKRITIELPFACASSTLI